MKSYISEPEKRESVGRLIKSAQIESQLTVNLSIKYTFKKRLERENPETHPSSYIEGAL